LAVIAVLSVIQVEAACDKSILIIGAGAAGLGAAKEAKSQNCTVTVLEARNRLGGRINTETMGASLKVDMGASWIHGIGPGLGDNEKYKGKQNPIYTLALDSKIATVATWQTVD
jgi:monoamine oxidase